MNEWVNWKKTVKVKVTQSCMTLWDPMDCTAHRILQGQNTRVGRCSLLWGSSQPRDEPRSPVLQAESLPAEPPEKPNEWVNCRKTMIGLTPFKVWGSEILCWKRSWKWCLSCLSLDLEGFRYFKILSPKWLKATQYFKWYNILFNHVFKKIVSSGKISTSLHLGEGNGNPLQYSCLENPRDGGAW